MRYLLDTHIGLWLLEIKKLVDNVIRAYEVDILWAG